MGNRIGIWTTATRPANPTAYQTLGYNTTIEAHESWNGTAWVGFFDPISTEGDLVVGDGTGQASRLGIGTDDQVLTVVSGVPAWADTGGGGSYYYITSSGTYPVDLEAGLYDVTSTDPVSIGGVDIDGQAGLVNYASGISNLVIATTLDPWNSQSSGFTQQYTKIYGLAYGNNVHVAVGYNGQITTSTDGITWTNRTSGFGVTYIRAVTFGDGLFVAGGDSNGKMSTSPDGITWTTRTSNTGNDIYSLTYGNGLFLAGGKASAFSTSPDGITWTSGDTGFPGVNAPINGLAYGNGVYVAVGQYYDGSDFQARMATSTNGSSWTNRTSQFSSSNIRGVTFGDGLFVAVGFDGQLTTSTNGTTWNSRTSGFGSTDDIYSVTYGDGLYVAGGEDGEMRASPDGITWTSRTSELGGDDILALNYGGGLFVAGGEDGTMSISIDGTNAPPEAVTIYVALELKTPVTTLS